MSSFHLWWQGLEGGPPLVAVSATLEVLHQPLVSRLYFWALQASFLDARRSHGAAHIGLQWNPRHAGSTAVNWGGYADAGNVQSVLTGTPSALPSTPNDPNTRDYPWRQAVPYRLAISRAVEGWRGEITDRSSATTSVIRDLRAGGDRLGGFAVWAEVFAACDDPPTAVRWSGFEAVDDSGRVHRPESVAAHVPRWRRLPEHRGPRRPPGPGAVHEHHPLGSPWIGAADPGRVRAPAAVAGVSR